MNLIKLRNYFFQLLEVDRGLGSIITRSPAGKLFGFCRFIRTSLYFVKNTPTLKRDNGVIPASGNVCTKMFSFQIKPTNMFDTPIILEEYNKPLTSQNLEGFITGRFKMTMGSNIAFRFNGIQHPIGWVLKLMKIEVHSSPLGSPCFFNHLIKKIGVDLNRVFGHRLGLI